MKKAAQPQVKIGAREAGRQLGVSHSYLLRLAKANRLPRNADGTFEVEACRRILASITDPAQVRGDREDKWSLGGDQYVAPVTSDHPQPTGLTRLAIDAAQHARTEFEAGFINAFVVLAHRVGAIAAVAAADEGAPLEVAYGLKDAFTLYFIDAGEDLLRELPSFRGLPADQEMPVRYEPSIMDQVGWDVVARERGETADIEAWDAAVRERRANARAAA